MMRVNYSLFGTKMILKEMENFLSFHFYKKWSTHLEFIEKPFFWKAIMKAILASLFLSFSFMGLDAQMTHLKKVTEEIQKEEQLLPFNELMLSWNAARPTKGQYQIYLSVKIDEWTPWLHYASWGSEGQSGYMSAEPDCPAKVCQSALGVEDKWATGFQIKIIAENDAILESITALHVYTNGDQFEEKQQVNQYPSSIYLPVQGLSQMTLNHARSQDLCSPTSTTAVVRFLSQNPQIDPVQFADKSWDKGFDLFGNWIFNIAQASAELGPNWNVWIERLTSFDDIYKRLLARTPVVVSVRGPLKNSALPYSKGHLLAVIGYDAEQQKVFCMDPAFPQDDKTIVAYNFLDFLEAWERRGKFAYIFSLEN
ncbi:Uncharacterized protein PHSC3_001813 [Chlamydiales bacterium STE3]|nr:Uncharacterized protein PHSC3_001813 [Chlamydiales bacterium STE3]